MAGSTQNLIQGVGFVYLAPIGTTEPANEDITATPAVDFVDLGFTMEGVTLTVAHEYSELDVDQVVDIPGRRLIKREVTVATSLAEATMANLLQAVNGLGAITTTSAGAAVPGTDAFEPSAAGLQGEPTYAMLLFDGFAPDGFPRRVLLRKALQVGEIEAAYSKDGQTVYPVEFAGHYISESVAPYKIVDQTAAATG